MITMTCDPRILRQSLAQFTGTERWHRHPLSRHVTMTDGALHFAEAAGAWWLMDIFATELLKILRTEGFVSLHCRVKNGEALLVADDGNGHVLWTRVIDHTDCPEGDWDFYMGEGGPDGTNVIMLPSEY